MSYVKPDIVLANMIQAGAAKAKFQTRDLFLRGALSGALLGFATTLSFTANLQTGFGIVGALVFPVGFVMIVLLGLELVTGNFALVPLGILDGKIGMADLLHNWTWVFAGNQAGGVLYAYLYSLTLPPDAPMAKLLATVSETKTLGYAKLGFAGLVRQSDSVQLDGDLGRRHGAHLAVDDRQNRGDVASDPHIFRAGLRALGG